MEISPKKYYRKSFQICTKISTGFLYKCCQVDATVHVGMKQSGQAHASWTTKGQVEGSALEGVTAVSAGSDWCRQRENSIVSQQTIKYISRGKQSAFNK